MVVIVERDEAERLKHAICRLADGAENLGHTAHGPRLRLKCKFDEGSISERTRQLQQAASRRNGLEFSFSVPAIF